jgi:predicted lipoprotein with Yx(FWY)xxD motif
MKGTTGHVLPRVGFLLIAGLVLLWANARPAPAWGQQPQAQADPPTVQGPAQGNATVLVGDSATLGPILTDSQGMTLYFDLNDSPDMSTCSGACANAWPPLRPPAEGLVAGPGVTGTLGVITRDDSSQQVTYNGMPLYYFVRDTSPGDTNGQGSTGAGGRWTVATP